MSWPSFILGFIACLAWIIIGLVAWARIKGPK